MKSGGLGEYLGTFEGQLTEWKRQDRLRTYARLEHIVADTIFALRLLKGGCGLIPQEVGSRC
jgi:hypothetical protein